MTTPYTATQLAHIVGGTCAGPKPNAPIQQLFLDSRTYNGHPAACFFALATATNNGHLFVADLATKGLQLAVVNTQFVNPAPHQLTLIHVPNVHDALQQFATYHRQQFVIPVVGITGSNGKTTVKEWLFQLLQPHFQVCRSPGSFNSQIGVPLSVWQLQPTDDLAIFEAGVSEPQEMPQLERVIRPTLGIFTNIGAAHQGNFESLNAKILEKSTLFTHVNKLLVCGQHTQLLAALQKALPNTQLITWGQDPGCFFVMQNIKKIGAITQLTLKYLGNAWPIALPFTDDAGVENALHAICAALLLGAPPETVCKNAKKLEHLSMRLELRSGRNNNLLINDAYSADPESISRALDFLKQHRAGKNVVVVLSDLMHLGKQAAAVYPQVADLMQRAQVDLFIGIGPAIAQYAHLFPANARYFLNSAALTGFLATAGLANSIILLKGARSFQLEKILETLAQKSHVTQLEVNLTALADNLRYFRTQLLPETKVMAMVKAFGYGGGSYEIAALLAYHRIDYLAVAYTDEGVALREAGITTPIMVMNTDAANFEKLVAYQLEPEIFSLAHLQSFLAVYGAMAGAAPTDIHLKIETGMNRLGFDAPALLTALQLLKKNPAVRVRSLFSHLAAAGQTAFSEFTQKQINTFTAIAQDATNQLGYKPLWHLLNSEGAQQHPLAQFDMVRLGIGLYGISNNVLHARHLRSVSALVTHISQLKWLEPSESVGYNRAFVATKPTRIATLPIGYADGYRRSLGNGVGKVWVNGFFAPVVGQVCMDMVMVDVTEIPCEEGDAVEVFGQHVSITQLAGWAGTISYEMLTGISQRVKRVYFQE